MPDKQVPSQRYCWMCGTAISLEECKLDEKGLPVHEDCYVARVVLNDHDRTLPSPDSRTG